MKQIRILMKKKRWGIGFILLIFVIMSFTVERQKNDIDYVPNKETATKVAEVLWLSIYGESIYEHKPFKANLVDDIWIVEGQPKKQKGGYPYAEIRKSDCKVIKITHYK